MRLRQAVTSWASLKASGLTILMLRLAAKFCSN